MTNSKHEYYAFYWVGGGSYAPLSGVKAGSITLDAGSSPHVRGTVEVSVPGTWTTNPLTYSAWTEQRRNVFLDPYFESDIAGSTSVTWPNGTAPTAVVSGAAYGRSTAVRFTTTATGAQRYFARPFASLAPSTTYTVRQKFRRANPVFPGTGRSFTLAWRPGSSSSTTGQVLIESNTVLAADQVYETEHLFTTLSTAVTGGWLGWYSTASNSTEWFEYGALEIELGDTRGMGWIGERYDAELSRVRALGTLGDSQTVLETRTVTNYAQPVWTFNATALAALDPRAESRLRLRAFSASGDRVFVLGIRDREVDHTNGTVRLTVASNEALLNDYAPLADDRTPLTYQSSLRSVINYVLGKVLPGTTLQSVPSNDAAATRYWAVTNLVPNPAARTAVGNWIGGGGGALTRATSVSVTGLPGVTTAFRTLWSANSGLGQGGAYSQAATIAPYVSVKENQTYTVSLYAYANVTKSVRLMAQQFGSDGQLLSNDVLIKTQTLTNGVWTRISGTVTLAANAARLGIYLYADTGTQWVAGNELYTTGWMVTEGTELMPYFDGATPNDGNYVYAPAGDLNNSASTRTPINEAPLDGLVWKAGQTAMEFLMPLVQVYGYRLVADESRLWTLRSENYTAPGSLSIRHGVNMIDGSDTISRDNELWFDAAITTYTWTDVNGIEQKRVDSYALNTPYARVRTFEKNVPYPGPGFSEYAVRRAQGRGREVTASAVSDWTARAEQPVTVVLENAPTQLGITQAVTYDLNTDRMTVTTRTTDTPAGAIDLLSGTIDALPGDIDSL